MGVHAERPVTGGVYCGIDPGREKFGFALASDGGLIFAAIIPFAYFGEALRYLSSGDAGVMSGWRTEGACGAPAPSVRRVFLGDGTSHELYGRAMREAGIDYTLAGESGTTLEAREIYWKLHPPVGLSRLIPISLRVPPRPLDDLAAWAIIVRSLGDSRSP